MKTATDHSTTTTAARQQAEQRPFFGADRVEQQAFFQPTSRTGIAPGADGGIVQRQAEPTSPLAGFMPELPEQITTGLPGLDDLTAGLGVGSPVCPVPAHCPSLYCSPYPNSALARLARDTMQEGLLAGISVKVNPRVVPFWRLYLAGGSAPLNVRSLFESEFTNSLNTQDAVDFLWPAIVAAVVASPPAFNPYEQEVFLDIPTLIPAENRAIGTPDDPNELNFSIINEIPGNLVGGIGHNQTKYKFGARPSPFDDFRGVEGKVRVRRRMDGSLELTPFMEFVVRDTIDFCPGNCGDGLELAATVPMSMFEASGISGDVPISIRYPAPTIPAHITDPGLVAPPRARGTVQAHPRLNLREHPTTGSDILGKIPDGTSINVYCRVTGEDILGDTTWYLTDGGYVSGRYVQITDGIPLNC